MREMRKRRNAPFCLFTSRRIAETFSLMSLRYLKLSPPRNFDANAMEEHDVGKGTSKGKKTGIE